MVLGDVQAPAGWTTRTTLWSPALDSTGQSRSAVQLHSRILQDGSLDALYVVLSDGTVVTFPYAAAGLSTTPTSQGLLPREEFAVLGTQWISLNDRVSVRGAGGRPTVVGGFGAWPYGGVWPNNDPFSVLVGTDVVAPEIWSQNVAWLRDRARVDGDIYTSSSALSSFPLGYTCQNCSTNSMTGKPFAVGTTGLARTLPSAPTFPAPTTLGTYIPTGAVSPGSFNELIADRGKTISLASGKYYFNSLKIEPDATVNVDVSSGPVYLLVKDYLIIRGRVNVSGHPEQLFIGYWGMQDVWVDSALTATLLAPNTTVELASNPKYGRMHQGAVFGAAVRVHQDAVVEHHPFLSLWPGDANWTP